MIDADPALAARDAVLGLLTSNRGQRTVAGQHDKYNSAPHGTTDQIVAITSSSSSATG